MVRTAVATQGGGLDDQVSQVFGRCQTYTFVDVEGGEIQGSEVKQNQYDNATGGAGIQAAGFIANQGADVVIAGNFGPNVASVFKQSGVEMVMASGMMVREAVQSYLDGNLQTVSQATAQTMSGSGGGRGMGRRMGRGMGGKHSSSPGRILPVRLSRILDRFPPRNRVNLLPTRGSRKSRTESVVWRISSGRSMTP